MDIKPDDGVYANKKMDSPAPREHGRSALQAVTEGGQQRIIPVVFIASDSLETGQWIPTEIQRANNKQAKAIRRAILHQNPLLLRQKIVENRVPVEEVEYLSAYWWRNR